MMHLGKRAARREHYRLHLGSLTKRDHRIRIERFNENAMASALQ